MAVIAIDFDGTLVNGDVPIKGGKEAINVLREKGHLVAIFSANKKPWIEKVLNENDIRYDLIVREDDLLEAKFNADVFVDDKGYHFKGNWNETLLDLLADSRVAGKDNRRW